MERWFVVENENKKGPFELAVLREMLIAGELALDTILLREGGVVQRKLIDVPEIFSRNHSASTEQREDNKVSGHVAEELEKAATRIAPEAFFEPMHKFVEKVSGGTQVVSELVSQEAAWAVEDKKDDSFFHGPSEITFSQIRLEEDVVSKNAQPFTDSSATHSPSPVASLAPDSIPTASILVTSKPQISELPITISPVSVPHSTEPLQKQEAKVERGNLDSISLGEWGSGAPSRPPILEVQEEEAFAPSKKSGWGVLDTNWLEKEVGEKDNASLKRSLQRKNEKKRDGYENSATGSKKNEVSA